MKKIILVSSLILIILGIGCIFQLNSVEYLLSNEEIKTQTYITSPTNILDNVFEADGMVILPFIPNTTNPAITEAYVRAQFGAAGIPISSISTTTIGTGTRIVTPNMTYTVLIYGDVNGDGRINSSDAQRIADFFVGYTTLTEIQKRAANVYNNNATINSTDAQRIADFFVGFQPNLVLNPPPHITGITITKPTKLTYFQGDPLELNGGTVSLVMSSAVNPPTVPAAIPMTSVMISGYNANTVGIQTVTVTHHRKTATFQVEVIPVDPLEIFSVVIPDLKYRELRKSDNNELIKEIKFLNYWGNPVEVDLNINNVSLKTVLPTPELDVQLWDATNMDVFGSVTDGIIKKVYLEALVDANKKVTLVFEIDGKEHEVDIDIGERIDVTDINISTADIKLYETMPAVHTAPPIIMSETISGYEFIFVLREIHLESSNYGNVKLRADQIQNPSGGPDEYKLSYGTDPLDPDWSDVYIRGFKEDASGNIVMVPHDSKDEIDYIGIAAEEGVLYDLKDATLTLRYGTIAEAIPTKEIDIIVPNDPKIVEEVQIVGLGATELRIDSPLLIKEIQFLNYLGADLLGVDASDISINTALSSSDITVKLLDINSMDVYGAVTDGIVRKISLETTANINDTVKLVLTIKGRDYEVEIDIAEKADVTDILISTADIRLYEEMPTGHTAPPIIVSETVSGYEFIFVLREIKLDTSNYGAIPLKANQILHPSAAAAADKLTYGTDPLDPDWSDVLIRGFKKDASGNIVMVPHNENTEIEYIGIASEEGVHYDLKDATLTLRYGIVSENITKDIDIIVDDNPKAVAEVKIVGLGATELRIDSSKLIKEIQFLNSVGTDLLGAKASDVTINATLSSPDIIVKLLDINAMDVTQPGSDGIIRQISLETTADANGTRTLVLTIDGKNHSVIIPIAEKAKVTGIDISEADVELFATMPIGYTGSDILVPEMLYGVERVFVLRTIKLETSNYGDIKLKANQILNPSAAPAAEKLWYSTDPFDPDWSDVIIRGFKLVGGIPVMLAEDSKEEIDFIGISTIDDNSITWAVGENLTLRYGTESVMTFPNLMKSMLLKAGV